VAEAHKGKGGSGGSGRRSGGGLNSPGTVLGVRATRGGACRGRTWVRRQSPGRMRIRGRDDMWDLAVSDCWAEVGSGCSGLAMQTCRKAKRAEATAGRRQLLRAGLERLAGPAGGHCALG
jgi:hypothetical protein